MKGGKGEGEGGAEKRGGKGKKGKRRKNGKKEKWRGGGWYNPLSQETKTGPPPRQENSPPKGYIFPFRFLLNRANCAI